MELLLSHPITEQMVTSIAPFVSESQNTFLVRVFNQYFIAVAIGGQIIKAVWMITQLGFDPLFTIIGSIFWLVSPVFNQIFLYANQSFKEQMINNYMWLLWTFALI